MSTQYVCPHCGSRKIGKEQENDDEYYCDDCCEFFAEPKLVTNEKPKEVEKMGNRYTTDIDREKIKVLAVDFTVPEISEATGYKINSIRAALRAMGIKAKAGKMGHPRKPSNHIAKPEIKKPLTLNKLDATTESVIALRNKYQEVVFTLNKVIELLSE